MTPEKIERNFEACGLKLAAEIVTLMDNHDRTRKEMRLMEIARAALQPKQG
jgi:diketogulonate reductase-like aldo/keto reductase